MSGNTQPGFYHYIDSLRGLAFLAVLLLHTRDRVPDLPRLLDDAGGRGYAGVQLFFVISAFTLCRSLSARSADAAPLQAYFLRRAFRIVPMFWCAIALYLAVYGFSDLSPRWGIPGGMTGNQLTLAVLLLHGFDIHAVNGVVPGGWSVATEVQFYVILPVMLAWASTLRRSLLLLGGAFALSIVAFPGLEAILGPMHPASEQIYVHAFAFFALPTQLPVFCCGLVLFRLMTSPGPLAPKVRLWPSLKPSRRAVLIVLAVAAVGLPLNVTTWPLRLTGGWLPGHVGYGVLATCLTYALATYPLGLLVNRYTRFLGRISYSSYLLHFLVLDALDPLAASMTRGHPVAHLFLLGGAALALTTAVAAITFALVEIPGIELGRRLIPQLATPNSLAARCGDFLRLVAANREPLRSRPSA